MAVKKVMSRVAVVFAIILMANSTLMGVMPTLFNLTGTQDVYAAEKDSSKKSSDKKGSSKKDADEGDGQDDDAEGTNILKDGGNVTQMPSSVKGKYEAAIGYNVDMQIMETYAIIRSQMGDASGVKSDYAKFYISKGDTIDIPHKTDFNKFTTDPTSLAMDNADDQKNNDNNKTVTGGCALSSSGADAKVSSAELDYANAACAIAGSKASVYMDEMKSAYGHRQAKVIPRDNDALSSKQKSKLENSLSGVLTDKQVNNKLVSGQGKAIALGTYYPAYANFSKKNTQGYKAIGGSVDGFSGDKLMEASVKTSIYDQLMGYSSAKPGDKKLEDKLKTAGSLYGGAKSKNSQEASRNAGGSYIKVSKHYGVKFKEVAAKKSTFGASGWDDFAQRFNAGGASFWSSVKNNFAGDNWYETALNIFGPLNWIRLGMSAWDSGTDFSDKVTTIAVSSDKASGSSIKTALSYYTGSSGNKGDSTSESNDSSSQAAESRMAPSEKNWQKSDKNFKIGNEDQWKKLVKGYKGHYNKKKEDTKSGNNNHLASWAPISSAAGTDNSAYYTSVRKYYGMSGQKTSNLTYMTGDFIQQDGKISTAITSNVVKDDDLKYVIGSAGSKTDDSISNSSLQPFIGTDIHGSNTSLQMLNPIVRAKAAEKDDQYGEKIFQYVSKNGGGSKGAIAYDVSDPSKSGSSARHTVGIDNYGTIMVGKTSGIFIPYWQNTTQKEFKDFAKDGAFVSTPASNNKLDSKKDKALASLKETAKEGSVTKDDVDKMLDDTKGANGGSKLKKADLESAANKAHEEFDKEMSVSDLTSKVTDKDNAFALAVAITAKTYKDVQKYNKRYITAAEAAGQMYVLQSDADFSDADKKKDDTLADFTAADLMRKIWILLNVGVGEILKLTMAQTVVNVYSSTLASSSLNSIFYTATIGDEDNYSSMILTIAKALILLMMIMLIIWTFMAYRGKLTWKGLGVRFVLLTVSLAIPLAYPIFTNFILNKPASLIVGQQLKQTSILDMWAAKYQAAVKSDDFLKQFFSTEEEDFTENFYGSGYAGTGADSPTKKALMQDHTSNYVVYFYTTTNKHGFDIDTGAPTNNTGVTTASDSSAAKSSTSGNSSGLSQADQVKEDRYKNKKYMKSPWSGNDLVKVAVSSFDLNQWATAMKDKTPGSDGYVDLFDWLTTESPNKAKYTGTAYGKSTLTGKQTNGGMAGMKEYHLDTNKYLTPAMTQLENSKDNLAAGSNGYKSITASDLYLLLWQQMNKNGSFKNLAKFSDMSVTAYADGTAIGKDAKSLFINDLSRTTTDRNLLYDKDIDAIKQGLNGDDASSKLVDAKNPMNSSTYRILSVLGYTDKDVPKSDLLGIDDIISKLHPYRDNSDTSLDGDIYQANKTFINQYLNNYAQVRQEVGNLTETYNSSENAAMALESLFILDDQFNMKLFPTTYEPNSVAFDSYIRMAFMPMGDFDPKQPYNTNTAQYITQRTDIFSMLAFLLAIFGLVIFGFYYMLLFYVVIEVITLWVFIYNFVIKSDYSSDSFIGTSVVYITHALVKAGLMLIFWGMNKALNYWYIKNGGAVPGYYPFLFSIIICVYLYFTFTKVLLPMFKTILSDKAHLGGSGFKAKGQQARGNMMGFVAGGMLGAGLGLAKGAGKTAGLGIKGAKGIGTGGKKVHGWLQKEGRNGYSHGHNIMNRVRKIPGVEQAAMAGAYLKSAPKNARNKIRSVAGGTWRKLKNPMKGAKAVLNNLAPGELPAAKANLEGYNAVEASKNGVDGSVTHDENGNAIDYPEGTELTGADNDKMTSWTFGDATQAKFAADALKKKGYNASAKGNKVVTNTKGMDVEHSSALRKELWEEANDAIGRKIVDIDRNGAHGIKENDKSVYKGTIPYTDDYSDPEKGPSEYLGRKFEIGDKGLNGSTLDALLSDQAILKNFVWDDEQVESLRGADGTINHGGITLTPTSTSAAGRQVAMDILRDTDARLRKAKGAGTRKEYENLSSMDLGSALGSNAHDVLTGLGATLPSGFKLQGNKLVFAANRKRQAQDILNQIKIAERSQKTDLANTSKGIMANVNDVRDGLGFKQFNNSDDMARALLTEENPDADVTQEALDLKKKALGIKDNMQYQTISTGSNTGNNIAKGLNNLKDASTAEGRQAVLDLVNTRKDLGAQVTKNLLGDGSASDNLEATKKLSNYAKNAASLSATDKSTMEAAMREANKAYADKGTGGTIGLRNAFDKMMNVINRNGLEGDVGNALGIKSPEATRYQTQVAKAADLLKTTTEHAGKINSDDIHTMGKAGNLDISGSVGNNADAKSVRIGAGSESDIKNAYDLANKLYN